MRDTLLKRLLIRYVFPYQSTQRILFGSCRGMKLRITPSSGHSPLLGYEGASQDFLKKRLKKGMVVYDIGAHVGQYALFFSKQVGEEGRVVSFEPLPQNFEELSFNIRLNALKNVEARHCAVGDRDGQTSFEVHSHSTRMGRPSGVEPTYRDPLSTVITVPAARLDTLLRELPPPDLLKIDVEGAGAAVLKGAQALIAKHKPSLFMELHGPEEQAAVQVLARSGYVFVDLKGQKVSDLVNEWHTPIFGTCS